MKEKPGDQYGMSIFRAMNWKSSKPISPNTENLLDIEERLPQKDSLEN
ncbi:hypothetical protein QIA30_05355 (plasmid) [Borreliella turdi]